VDDPPAVGRVRVVVDVVGPVSLGGEAAVPDLDAGIGRHQQQAWWPVVRPVCLQDFTRPRRSTQAKLKACSPRRCVTSATRASRSTSIPPPQIVRTRFPAGRPSYF
jgi:hypothetical protein